MYYQTGCCIHPSRFTDWFCGRTPCSGGLLAMFRACLLSVSAPNKVGGSLTEQRPGERREESVERGGGDWCSLGEVIFGRTGLPVCLHHVNPHTPCLWSWATQAWETLSSIFTPCLCLIPLFFCFFFSTSFRKIVALLNLVSLCVLSFASFSAFLPFRHCLSWAC